MIRAARLRPDAAAWRPAGSSRCMPAAARARSRAGFARSRWRRSRNAPAGWCAMRWSSGSAARRASPAYRLEVELDDDITALRHPRRQRGDPRAADAARPLSAGRPVDRRGGARRHRRLGRRHRRRQLRICHHRRRADRAGAAGRRSSPTRWCRALALFVAQQHAADEGGQGQPRPARSTGPTGDPLLPVPRPRRGRLARAGRAAAEGLGRGEVRHGRPGGQVRPGQPGRRGRAPSPCSAASGRSGSSRPATRLPTASTALLEAPACESPVIAVAGAPAQDLGAAQAGRGASGGAVAHQLCARGARPRAAGGRPRPRRRARGSRPSWRSGSPRRRQATRRSLRRSWRSSRFSSAPMPDAPARARSRHGRPARRRFGRGRPDAARRPGAGRADGRAARRAGPAAARRLGGDPDPPRAAAAAADAGPAAGPGRARRKRRRRHDVNGQGLVLEG